MSSSQMERKQEALPMLLFGAWLFCSVLSFAVPLVMREMRPERYTNWGGIDLAIVFLAFHGIAFVLAVALALSSLGSASKAKSLRWLPLAAHVLFWVLLVLNAVLSP